MKLSTEEKKRIVRACTYAMVHTKGLVSYWEYANLRKKIEQALNNDT